MSLQTNQTTQIPTSSGSPAPVANTVTPTPSATMQSTPSQSTQPQVPSSPFNLKLDNNLQNVTYLTQEGYIENGSVQVIVKLSNDSTPLLGSLASFDGSLIQTFSELSMAVVSIPYSQLDNFASLPCVTNVYLDSKIQCLDSNSLPIIEPPSEWSTITQQYGDLTGLGEKIAILDTGIDPNHPDFFFANGTSKILASIDFTGSGHTTDGYGHGTHCASIAAGTGYASSGLYRGVASGASLINVKVMNDSGSGKDSWAIQGIQWAVNNQSADILSMSFGASTQLTDGSDALCQAVDWATNKGIVCCVAAGNNGGAYSSINTPACAKTAIAVGSCNNSKGIASTSSCGPTSDYRIKPDVVAPGVDITAARANGTSQGKLVNQYYTTLSGTSMATPHVAGAAALIKQAHPTWTAQQIKVALVESASLPPIQSYNDPLVVGGGIIDVANAISVSNFASNSSVSFSVTQATTPKILTSNLTFTLSNVSSYFVVGKSASSLPFPLMYANSSVVFSCPANTTAEWSGRLYVDGGSQFTGYVSIPALAVTQYSPPTVSTWTTVKTVSTSTCWPRAFAVAGDRLYVADSYYSGLILEYQLPDLVLLRTLKLPETMINTVAVADGTLYAGTTYGFIFQIPLSTFTVKAETTTPSNSGITKLLVCNSKLYVTTWNGTLCKFDPINLSLLSSKRLDVDIQDGVMGNGNLYFVTSTGYLWVVDPQSLNGSRVSLGENGFGLNSLVVANGNLYAVANNYPGVAPYVFGFFPQIFKVSFNLTVLDHVALRLPQLCPSLTLTYDENGLYVLSHYSPDITTQTDTIQRIDFGTLKAEATLNSAQTLTHITGFWTDQPFLSRVESIVAWNNSIIVGFDSGKLALTKDTTPEASTPTFMSFNVNSTRSGQPCQIASWWHSKAGLSGFVFSNYMNGAWQNQSWKQLSGTLATANTTFTLIATAGNSVVWRVYCNDSNNRWSQTDSEAFTVTSSNYRTLTVLPSECSGTNPTVGNYSYPEGTVVTVSVNEPTTKGYKFQSWLVDGVQQGAVSLTLVMDGDHVVQPVNVLTDDDVKWERFSPIHIDMILMLYSNLPYHAETFTVGDTQHSVTSVKLYIGILGKPTGPVTVSIRATQNGVPTGEDLASGPINLSDLPSAQPNSIAFTGWITVPMTYPSSPIVLNPNTQYAVVISTPNDDSSNNFGWGGQFFITQYSGGKWYAYNVATSSWQRIVFDQNIFGDINGVFQIWGTTINPDAPTPTLTSTTSTTTSTSTSKPTTHPTASPQVTSTPINNQTASPTPTISSGPINAHADFTIVIAAVVIAVLATTGAFAGIKLKTNKHLP